MRVSGPTLRSADKLTRAGLLRRSVGGSGQPFVGGWWWQFTLTDAGRDVAVQHEMPLAAPPADQPQPARLWVCVPTTPGGYRDLADLPLADALTRWARRAQTAAADIAALAAAGWEIGEESDDPAAARDYCATRTFASLAEAVDAVQAAGVSGRMLDFGDDTVEL